MDFKVAAWQDSHNGAGGLVNWRFSTDDARIELRKLCPTFDG
ncbi:hypothetical protein [Methylomagnum sp.]